MAEKKESGLSKITVDSNKQLALEELRLQGHTYIDLRPDGKRFVFFCILCLEPCDSTRILHKHFEEITHKERLACAMRTLIRTNPWPFSDGRLFFDTSTSGKEEETKSDTSSSGPNLIISGFLINDRPKFIGLGRIAARLFETKGRTTWIDKLWCEWLGHESPSDEDKATVPKHDFAILTFSYFHNLGSLEMIDDLNRFLTSCPSAESRIDDDSCRERKKSHLAPGETSNSSSNSSEEVSSGRNYPPRAPTVDISMKPVKNKTETGELDRKCQICVQTFLPGKDVAAILNLKTRNLVCGRTHPFEGGFHVFHVSCLVHWFLFCENERSNELTNDIGWETSSVFCPECHGTGINAIERRLFPSTQAWRVYCKIGKARCAWWENPEELKNCSTGLRFPHGTDESGQVPVQEERVEMRKLVRFYRVEF